MAPCSWKVVSMLLLFALTWSESAAQAKSCYFGGGKTAPYKQEISNPGGLTCISYCYKCIQGDQGCTADEITAGLVRPVYAGVSADSDATLKSYQTMDFNPYCKYSSCVTDNCQKLGLICPKDLNKGISDGRTRAHLSQGSEQGHIGRTDSCSSVPRI